MEPSTVVNLFVVSIVLLIVLTGLGFALRKVTKTIKANNVRSEAREQKMLNALAQFTSAAPVNDETNDAPEPAAPSAAPVPPPPPTQTLESFFVGTVQPKAPEPRVPVPSPAAVTTPTVDRTALVDGGPFEAALADLVESLHRAARLVEDEGRGDGLAPERAARAAAALTAALGALPLREVISTAHDAA